MIKVKNLSKDFLLGDDTLRVLKKLSFTVKAGEWMSLTGPSGSGKSTLLSLLAGLEAPTEGEIVIADQNMALLDEESRSEFRAQNMGFIFQAFRLMPHLTALENVQIPLEILNHKNSRDHAEELLKRVGLGSRLGHFPAQLSGGEQQRVAIARAFVHSPKILFADEPTGNLDSKNGQRVLELLRDFHLSFKATLIVVTHDESVAAHAQSRIVLRDGEIQQ